MLIIKTKNESYTGEISGIAFLNGTAKVKDLSTTDIEWFKSYGHTVEETTEEVTTEETNVEEAKTEEVSKNKKGK
ncbi:hypothetical protein CTN00_01815 [Fusobacterium pseudoperiodonticum]|jgi:hypothetical protein|uniref:hypothetical protein n=1 Tax=Fusobacterium pseudoperiodonticum TaxID=2663009 RepID=UPI000C1BD424|nr:hypothetical protein [Fusobacterium pseudoperiodonticum]ATV71822.1 hypothetical protein CTN00_01815 [Fusobacterium pseudoperiodonticum]DAW59700.1 MAG TPA: hypothetical protein [Caudoviricetes sp.]